MSIFFINKCETLECCVVVLIFHLQVDSSHRLWPHRIKEIDTQITVDHIATIRKMSFLLQIQSMYSMHIPVFHDFAAEMNIQFSYLTQMS